MIRKSHYVTSTVAHVCLVIILMLSWHWQPSPGPDPGPAPGPRSGPAPLPAPEEEVVKVTIQPAPQEAEKDGGQPGRYEAVPGSLTQDPNDVAQPEPVPEKIAENPVGDHSATDNSQQSPSAPAVTGNGPEPRQPDASRALTSAPRSPTTRANFGNASFKRSGHTVPSYTINNLTPELLNALGQSGDAILYARLECDGQRKQYRFEGPITAPTSAVPNGRFDGFSERGPQVDPQIREAAIRLLSKQFLFSRSDLAKVDVWIMFSDPLDTTILSAQRTVVATRGLTMADVAWTSGNLATRNGRIEFVIDQIEPIR